MGICSGVVVPGILDSILPTAEVMALPTSARWTHPHLGSSSGESGALLPFTLQMCLPLATRAVTQEPTASGHPEAF